VIEHRFPLDQDEITQIIALLNRERWVKLVRYPGRSNAEICVDCQDGKSWSITAPLHLVRLKYQYRQKS